VCAAMGLANLESIDNVFAANYRNLAAYKADLQDLPGIRVLDYDPDERNSHHYVVLEINERSNATRDQVIAALHAENVLARKYFWPGCHDMKPYRDLFPHAGLMLSGTRQVADRVIVLPTGTAIGVSDIASISSIIRLLAAASD